MSPDTRTRDRRRVILATAQAAVVTLYVIVAFVQIGRPDAVSPLFVVMSAVLVLVVIVNIVSSFLDRENR